MSEQPPQDVTAEQSVLGAMILAPRIIPEISDVLTGTDFYRPAHETIFRTILALHVTSNVDVVTVSDALNRDGELTRSGGPAYLHELVATTPTASNAMYYADIVVKLATRRRLAIAGQKITQLASQPGDIDELVELSRKEVDQTSKATITTSQFLGETIDSMLSSLDEKPDHTPTPWSSLNGIIGGLRPGGLYVVAARPSVGKSVIALQLAKELSKKGSVAFASLEMSKNDVLMRFTAADLRIDLGRILRHELNPGDWTKIRDHRARWDKIPIAIEDNSGMTLMDIRQFARSTNRRLPLAGIVVDYLQLMSQTSGDRRSRQDFVADMSRQLKILAMEMNVPVIALSQLNRNSESREDRMPRLNDLRESGAIEQDADVVILMHRDIMGENYGELSLAVAKNRNGATSTARLTFFGHYCLATEVNQLPSTQSFA